MTDLVERLRDDSWRTCRSLRKEAAIAIEAKEAEIAALRERLSEQTRMIQNDHDLRRADISRIQTLDARLKSAEARVETAERELDALSSSHRDLAKRLAAIGRERDEARAALKAFLPDPTMMDILWGDMDDEATGTHTIKLKHFRAARAVIEKE